MKIEILDEAQEDLIQGFHFYEKSEMGVGSYFLNCLFSDIDSLLYFAEIHRSFTDIIVPFLNVSLSPSTMTWLES